MSLSPHSHCPRCKITTGYIDDDGMVFAQRKSHSDDDCEEKLKLNTKELEQDLEFAQDELRKAQVQVQNLRARLRGKTITFDQKKTLIGQSTRWKRLLERECYRHYMTKKAITHLCATLDYRVETSATDCMTPDSVAEYVCQSLCNILKDSSK